MQREAEIHKRESMWPERDKPSPWSIKAVLVPYIDSFPVSEPVHVCSYNKLHFLELS